MMASPHVPPDAKRQAGDLRRLIEYHNHRYYLLDEPAISDAEHDGLMRQLAALEAPATNAERGAAEASGEAYESFDDLLWDGPMAVPPARYESFDDLFTDEPNDGASETQLELAEPRTAEPEPDARSDAEPEIAETAAEEPAAAAAPPTSAPPRRRRKISFV